MQLSLILSVIKKDIHLISWHLFVNIICASKVLHPIIRGILYKVCGLNIKNLGSISGGCFFGSSLVSIGNKTSVNYNCFFDSFDQISIGENCLIAMEVMFCTSRHEITGNNLEHSQIKKRPTGLPIKVENNCWIGARSTILPGVVIHEGCIIAAGSVVVKNCEPHSLYGGVPAKKIKTL